jgi:hypothetical protein
MNDTSITSVQILGNQWGEGIISTIEDMRVYNRTLSNEEIYTIYRSYGGDGINSGLVMRLLFNEGIIGANPSGASSIIDSSGNGNNGSYFGVSNSNYIYQEARIGWKKKRPL